MTTPKRRPRFTFTVGTAEARAESSTMTTEQFEAARERAGIRDPRERPMSDYEPDGELVEVARRAIFEHRSHMFDCRCGESFGGHADLADAAEAFQQHQAAAVLRAIGSTLLGQGWDAGWHAGYIDRHRERVGDDGFVIRKTPTPNPYEGSAS